MNKKLFCIIGRTSSGKTSLTKEVAKQLNLKVVKSYTTRPLRPGEIEEESDHYFISEDEYPKYQKDIIAYTEINGYRYFATREELDKTDIYVIDPKGFYELLYWYSIGKIQAQPIPIYIYLPDSLGYIRACARGDNMEVWQERSKAEDSQFKDFESVVEDTSMYSINNNIFEDSIERLKDIITKEQGS